jgi:hypothetical protein
MTGAPPVTIEQHRDQNFEPVCHAWTVLQRHGRRRMIAVRFTAKKS